MTETDETFRRIKAAQAAREADPRAYNAIRDVDHEQCPYSIDHDDPDEGSESCMWRKGHEGLHTTHWGRTKGYWYWQEIIDHGSVEQD